MGFCNRAVVKRPLFGYSSSLASKLGTSHFVIYLRFSRYRLFEFWRHSYRVGAPVKRRERAL